MRQVILFNLVTLDGFFLTDWERYQLAPGGC